MQGNPINGCAGSGSFHGQSVLLFAFLHFPDAI
jgi:hypothetical protein